MICEHSHLGNGVSWPPNKCRQYAPSEPDAKIAAQFRHRCCKRYEYSND